MATEVSKDYSYRMKKQIQLYGGYKIIKIVICRKPVMEMIDTMLNFLTKNSWDDLKVKYGYDKMFHLSMICHLETGYSVVLEKLSLITLTRNEGRENEPNVDLKDVPKSLHSDIRLEEFLRNSKTYMGDKYFYYDGMGSDGREPNNCQSFIKSCLYANRMGSPDLVKFIYQPINELAKELPGFVKTLTKMITDLTGYIEDIGGTVKQLVGLKTATHLAVDAKQRETGGVV